MKKFDEIIKKINFKKIAIIYIITAIIVGIASLGFLGYMFRDKITLALNYNSISEKVDRNDQGINAITGDLSNFASKSNDIVDILILDNTNKITYNAKKSELAKSGTLDLQPTNEKEQKYLIDKNNPNEYFKLIKEDSLLLTTSIFDDDNKIEKFKDDDYFYENNFSDKKFYTLSYIIDKSSGDKIYIISDIHPVENGELYIKIVAALAVMFFMIYWVLVALWVYSNALKSKLNYVLWGIITLITNIAGLFVYLIYKQNNQACFKCGAVQTKGNIFCTNCGIKSGNTCLKCSAVIKQNDNFCHRCGNKISDN
mgnify:CR=1 FL=1